MNYQKVIDLFRKHKILSSILLLLALFMCFKNHFYASLQTVGFAYYDGGVTLKSPNDRIALYWPIIDNLRNFKEHEFDSKNGFYWSSAKEIDWEEFHNKTEGASWWSGFNPLLKAQDIESNNETNPDYIELILFETTHKYAHLSFLTKHGAQHPYISIYRSDEGKLLSHYVICFRGGNGSADSFQNHAGSPINFKSLKDSLQNFEALNDSGESPLGSDYFFELRQIYSAVFSEDLVKAVQFINDDHYPSSKKADVTILGYSIGALPILNYLTNRSFEELESLLPNSETKEKNSIKLANVFLYNPAMNWYSGADTVFKKQLTTEIKNNNYPDTQPEISELIYNRTSSFIVRNDPLADAFPAYLFLNVRHPPIGKIYYLPSKYWNFINNHQASCFDVWQQGYTEDPDKGAG